jgi:putative DNA primase/helicase
MNSSIDRGLMTLDAVIERIATVEPSPSPDSHVSSMVSRRENTDINASIDTSQINAHVPVELPRGFSIRKDGVYFAPPKTDDQPSKPFRICGPLRVTALSRDRSSENWGCIVEFSDPDGVHHKWAIPMAMLASDGPAVRRELSRLGLSIAPGNEARFMLPFYLNESNPATRVRSVEQTGWFKNVFVLPDRTIGNDNESILYQSLSKTTTQYSQRGTLDQWRTHVSKKCAGNSRLIFAVSAAFAGMILRPAGQESGGFHFVGGSSTGKSTGQLISASVYGGPAFKQSWRATANALEGACSTHNDTALILDEMGEVEPTEVGSIVYMISNGTGKGRADRNGEPKQRAGWRLMIISSGEIGLVQHMRDGGRIAKTGQEVRMIDISADAGSGHGMFENLHQHESGADFADALKEATKNYYGTPAIEFLNNLVRDLATFSSELNIEMAGFIIDNLPAGAAGQAARVCKRFAVIASAGEYATRVGITGWHPGEAIAAASKCFRAWLDERGGKENQEGHSILSQVKAFFELHSECRFTDVADESSRRTINRAGFRKVTPEGYEYYVLPEAFQRDVCSGLDTRVATRVLLDAGWLEPDNAGKSSQRKTLPQIGLTRVYVFTPKVWRE